MWSSPIKNTDDDAINRWRAVTIRSRSSSCLRGLGHGHASVGDQMGREGKVHLRIGGGREPHVGLDIVCTGQKNSTFNAAIWAPCGDHHTRENVWRRAYFSGEPS